MIRISLYRFPVSTTIWASGYFRNLRAYYLHENDRSPTGGYSCYSPSFPEHRDPKFLMPDVETDAFWLVLYRADEISSMVAYTTCHVFMSCLPMFYIDSFIWIVDTVGIFYVWIHADSVLEVDSDLLLNRTELCDFWKSNTLVTVITGNLVVLIPLIFSYQKAACHVPLYYRGLLLLMYLYLFFASCIIFDLFRVLVCHKGPKWKAWFFILKETNILMEHRELNHIRGGLLFYRGRWGSHTS